ncbi:MAG: iron ABC transporter permease [Candidatus Faecousia sp.]|nr:iron ABC transporter permease [Candidatus Faecousia sp.]
MRARQSGAAGLLEQYEAGQAKNVAVILAGVVLMLALAVIFAALGATDTSPGDILRTVGCLLQGKELTTPQMVILRLRLPRVVMAMLAGAGLSVSGAAMQGITRNPLVSPFTIGVSNAAAFGASLSIVFGWGILPGTETGTVMTASMLAFASAALVYLVSLRAGLGPESLVLTGIAINYLFSAATSLIQYFADEHKLAAAVAWAFGSFNGVQWREVATTAVAVLVTGVALFFCAPSLDLLSSGDDEVASSIGINPKRVRVLAGALSVISTAAIISFTGVIGFIGLAGPHIARLLLGSGHRNLIPFSAVVGAILTLTADTIGRLILAPILIPVGIVVSFLGVPIFVNLILTRWKGGA